MNKYRAGADFERQVRKDYEDRGWLCIRSAGSKSPIDLVALHKSGSVVLIQCKRVSREHQIKALVREFNNNLPFEPAAYTQILAVKVKGNNEYKKFYGGQEQYEQ